MTDNNDDETDPYWDNAFRDDFDFNINEFFNKLPLFIMGTQDDPKFYAQQVLDLLQLINPDETTVQTLDRYLDPHHYISEILPHERSLIDFYILTKKETEKMDTDEEIQMIHIDGVYHLLLASRTFTGAIFRKHMKKYIYSKNLYTPPEEYV